ncbi:MAG: hypothetical protein P8099_15470 [Gemmatimonadota bacterium]|jgi:hypothetical protein
MPIHREFSRTKVLAWGAVIGVLWIAMAVTSLVSAVHAYVNDRTGWGLAWMLVGLLLGTAGVSALVGTWWHVFRVARRD